MKGQFFLMLRVNLDLSNFSMCPELGTGQCQNISEVNVINSFHNPKLSVRSPRTRL